MGIRRGAWVLKHYRDPCRWQLSSPRLPRTNNATAPNKPGNHHAPTPAWIPERSRLVQIVIHTASNSYYPRRAITPPGSRLAADPGPYDTTPPNYGPIDHITTLKM